MGGYFSEWEKVYKKVRNICWVNGNGLEVDKRPFWVGGLVCKCVREVRFQCMSTHHSLNISTIMYQFFDEELVIKY